MNYWEFDPSTGFVISESGMYLTNGIGNVWASRFHEEARSFLSEEEATKYMEEKGIPGNIC